MSEIEEVQELMKVDMEAIKGQMSTMMEAMMSMRKMMEVNAAIVVAASTTTEVDPTHPLGFNQVNHPASDMVGQGGKELGSADDPNFVQVQNKHGLPPNYTPPNVAHTPNENVDNSAPMPIVRKFDRCFTRPSTFLIQIYICLTFVFSSAFPNSFLRFTKSFQTLCCSMATSSKETAASGSPSVPSSPHQEQPELNIQPIQIIPGQASVPEKLVPRRPQGVKIAENPSPAMSPREVDTEMDKKIRSIVSSILKDASVPEADEDVPTSSNPNVSVPDVKKDVPTSSAPNAEALPSPSEEGSTEEDDQAAEETPAPRAPEPAPGDLIDLEEVESDEEPIANRLAPGIAERLQSRKGKTPLKRSGRIKTMAHKKSTPITPATSRRSKVAIPSKKRKEISSSDSDEDVELDVSTSKKAKTSGKKVPGNVPDAPLDNISFHSIGNAERWKFVYQRRLALERELGRAALDCKEIMDLIKAAGLLKTVSKLGDCYEGLVREFIVNIPSDISNRKSDDYQRVFVRGKCVRFSPAVINKYLGRPTDGVIDIDVSEHQIAKEITAKRVQHWPRKGKLSAGKLSVKYAILHRIGAANWVPTNHTSTIATGLGKFLYAVGTKSKFNFGNYIFDQTVKHSESFAVKLPIAFPTVLCGIMLSQHPNMLNYTDSVMLRESPLSLHYKLFEGTHVPDIVSTSVSTSGKAAASGAVSKDALIAELKDTCKVLEATIKATTEKKMELELLIKRLSETPLNRNLDDFEPHLRCATEGQAVGGVPLPNTLEGPQFCPQPQPLHFAVGRVPPAKRWRDLAAQVALPMMEREMITMIVDMLPVFYYEKMVGYTPSSFADLVFVGERIEEGETHVEIVVPTWPNFPPDQQYQYSANISPSQYPPPYQPRTLNHPQRPPLNHPIPNTTLNTNQNTNRGRNFPEKKPVDFTPILVSYANLLPYLLNNAMVAITSTKVPQPPFFRGYNSDATCAYHGGVSGHSIEHCKTLKHKVQSLINAGWLRFEEENHS
ncbi:hypothetical protein HKD37_04G010762 [Glycine soja]